MRQSISPRRFAAQQNGYAVLPYIHCNDNRANDSMNHSLPNDTFGNENNRLLRLFSLFDHHYAEIRREEEHHGSKHSTKPRKNKKE